MEISCPGGINIYGIGAMQNMANVKNYLVQRVPQGTGINFSSKQEDSKKVSLT